jgi:hypothetical protein
MYKTAMIININSMNALPVMERWLGQIHAPETFSRIGPWLTRYQSYRACPPPPEMYADVEKYGYYNWRVTELWYKEPYPQPGILPQAFFPNYKTILGMNQDLASDVSIWSGTPDGSRTTARYVVAARPTEDFKGSDRPLSDYRSILRWYMVFKYPAGVDREEADRWYLDVHTKEVLKQPGLTRFFSHKVVRVEPNQPDIWHRASELWYEDFDGWRDSVIVNPPKYTKPSWATKDTYPFFSPFVDFVSTFVLEAPTNNFWRDYAGYYVSV